MSDDYEEIPVGGMNSKGKNKNKSSSGRKRKATTTLPRSRLLSVYIPSLFILSNASLYFELLRYSSNVHVFIDFQRCHLQYLCRISSGGYFNLRIALGAHLVLGYVLQIDSKVWIC